MNQIWPALSPLINLFTPQQKLVTKTRVGAKVTKRYDRAQTPYQRLLSHPDRPRQADARRLRHPAGDDEPGPARRESGRLCATLLERVQRKNRHHPSQDQRASTSPAPKPTR